ncbi:isoprenylcysteine carboxylmethyltransferase family protein [Ancylothrix sp. C2]|uniref:methyltransferase family protein n=1 Tax=Ancylothrix sp. D3o TaxID=2953691 RepID=UPI0021BAE4A5|nr:isoprenylcysteine carboxylmethyltransferase family protein [Ancylothrix sp. D3o]MCT7949592.1 isoprenylcysteine carboxylmethyltransferase family protein [Ancylothrix sp. D3o]
MTKDILREWGFTREGWRTGQKGEYLVLLQGLLLVGFFCLPVYKPAGLKINTAGLHWGIWIIAVSLAIAGGILIIKALLDLGNNLTPLPQPKETNQLVQTGIYSIVRHPLYSGIIFLGLAFTIYHQSLTHLLGSLILFIFFDIKAKREENLLSQKHSDYPDYQKRVKKLLPGLY